jgi:LuxR family maltose regulon positive regulatory protein
MLIELVAKTPETDIDTIKLQFKKELSVGTGSFLVNTFLKADYALNAGDEKKALITIRQALMLAKNHSLVFLEWLHPNMVERLLRKALEANIETDFATRLLARYNESAASDINTIEKEDTLRVYTLGKFSIIKGGSPVKSSGKAQQRPLDLLRIIISYGGQGISKERVSESLWPDADGDQAHRSFATTLHRLRKLIGKNTVGLSDSKLSLNWKYVWLDVNEFEKLLTRAAVGDLPEIIYKDIENALSLYNGNFLQEEESSWVISKREQLRNKLLGTLNHCGNVLRNNKMYDQAETLYKRALEVDEVAEEAYQGLLLTYKAHNKRAEAISAYLQCRKILMSTLGVTPSPETEAIYLSLQED